MKLLNLARIQILVLLGLISISMSNATAQSTPQEKIELLWLGQAGFRVKTPGGKPL